MRACEPVSMLMFNAVLVWIALCLPIRFSRGQVEAQVTEGGGEEDRRVKAEEEDRSQRDEF